MKNPLTATVDWAKQLLHNLSCTCTARLAKSLRANEQMVCFTPDGIGELATIQATPSRFGLTQLSRNVDSRFDWKTLTESILHEGVSIQETKGLISQEIRQELAEKPAEVRAIIFEVCQDLLTAKLAPLARDYADRPLDPSLVKVNTLLDALIAQSLKKFHSELTGQLQSVLSREIKHSLLDDLTAQNLVPKRSDQVWSPIVPYNTILTAHDSDTTVIVMEDEPMIRTVFLDTTLLEKREDGSITNDDVKKARNEGLQLAMPYVIYVVTLSLTSKKMQVFFSNKRITELGQILSICPLPNLLVEFVVCYGVCKFAAKTSRDICLELVEKFWSGRFNNIRAERLWAIQEKDVRLRTFWQWHKATKQGPSFILSVEWDSLQKTLQRVVDGSLNSGNSGKIRQAAINQYVDNAIGRVIGAIRDLSSAESLNRRFDKSTRRAFRQAIFKQTESITKAMLAAPNSTDARHFTELQERLALVCDHILEQRLDQIIQDVTLVPVRQAREVMEMIKQTEGKTDANPLN